MENYFWDGEKKCWFDNRNSTIDFALNAQEQWIWRELGKTPHGSKHQLMVWRAGTQVPKTRQTKLSSGQINWRKASDSCQTDT